MAHTMRGRLLSGKPLLELFVKVTPKWGRIAEQLKPLGDELPEQSKTNGTILRV